MADEIEHSIPPPKNPSKDLCIMNTESLPRQVGQTLKFLHQDLRGS
jgi:hypothetical protein